jgi:hypothetical protein
MQSDHLQNIGDNQDNLRKRGKRFAFTKSTKVLPNKNSLDNNIAIQHTKL